MSNPFEKDQYEVRVNTEEVDNSKAVVEEDNVLLDDGYAPDSDGDGVEDEDEYEDEDEDEDEDEEECEECGQLEEDCACDEDDEDEENGY